MPHFRGQRRLEVDRKHQIDAQVVAELDLAPVAIAHADETAPSLLDGARHMLRRLGHCDDDLATARGRPVHASTSISTVSRCWSLRTQ